MSTVRAARRWIYVRRHRAEIDRRSLIGLSCTAVVVFAGFFALGRVTPTAAPSEQGSAVLIESGGVAIPASLGGAPPIGLEQAAPRSVAVPVESPVVSTLTPATIAVASSSSSVTRAPYGAPATETVSPVAASTPVSVVPAPAATTAPSSSKAAPPSAGNGGSSGGSKSEKSQGTSFDSSG